MNVFFLVTSSKVNLIEHTCKGRIAPSHPCQIPRIGKTPRITNFFVMLWFFSHSVTIFREKSVFSPSHFYLFFCDNSLTICFHDSCSLCPVFFALAPLSSWNKSVVTYCMHALCAWHNQTILQQYCCRLGIHPPQQANTTELVCVTCEA